MVRFIRGDGALLSVAIADVTNKLSEVKLVICQFVPECLKQFRVGGRVADANVIARVDDSASHKVSPAAVGNAG